MKGDLKLMLESFNLPTYDEDCDCLKVCEKLAGTYEMCYKGADVLMHGRCSIETQQLLLQKERQNPGAFSRLISVAERITLWLIAVAGFALAVYALYK